MNQLDWEKKHYKRVAGYAKQMDEIFTEAAKEAAAIGALFDANDLFSQPFNFKDYPQTKQRVDKMMQDLHKGVSTVVVNGATAEWENSNLVNDQLAMRVLGIANKDQIPDKFRKYFNNNNQALKAFLERKEKGLNLSDRVWKYTNAFKQEIELGLDAGIRAGKPASEMARDLKQYLREPNKLFRRVRDQHGNLQLSRAAKAYHPGRGVYRSSYKNAMRLTRTETNMAYRAANHTRMQQLDFVVGIEVRLTNNPAHIYDICDELKGRYPKDFKFVGWHPHCMCHAITIIKTPQELDQDIEKIQNGEPTNTASQNKVEGLPQNFKEWAERNKDRIATAKSQPYFIRDNFTGAKVEDWFKNQQVVPATAIPAPLEVPMAQRVLAKTENEMPEELKNFLKHNPDAKIIEFKVEQLREKIITWEQNNYNVSPTDKAKVDALVAMTKKQWDNLPPVIYERYTVDGGWKVIDGWHRTAAAIRRGETKINAVVKDYLTAAEKSAARHAARTPEQRAAIQKAWDERKQRLTPAPKPAPTKIETPKLEAPDKPKPYSMDSNTHQKLERDGWTISTGKKHTNTMNLYEDLQNEYSRLMGNFNMTELNTELNALMSKNNMIINRQALYLQKSKAEIIISGTYEGERFRMMRVFKTDAKGRMYVEHAFLSLPKNLQGNGFTKQLFQSFYKQYQNAGVKKIDVHANIDVGGYAWGRYGFSTKLKSIDEFISNYQQRLTPSEKTELSVFYSDWKKQNPKAKLFPMRQLADQPYGKKMMLGSDWFGSIDLTDKNARQIFEDYLFFGK